MTEAKQKIWDEYQPRLQEINDRRHQAKNPGELSQKYTDIVIERNSKIDAVN